MKTTVKREAVNWVCLQDPIQESEVRIDLGLWTADARTRQAIKRQAAVMGFESPNAYLHQLIAAVIAGNEEDTILANDGRILRTSDGYDRDGLPQDV
jgi:hypothetical protein